MDGINDAETGIAHADESTSTHSPFLGLAVSETGRGKHRRLNRRETAQLESLSYTDWEQAVRQVLVEAAKPLAAFNSPSGQTAACWRA